MHRLRRFINSRQSLATAVSVFLGLVLSVVHDAMQLALLPLGEWARVSFMARPDTSDLTAGAVNFSFQAISFGAASLPTLLVMRALLDFRTLRHPAIAFFTYYGLTLWWFPLGLVVGFNPEILPVLSLIPIGILAHVLVFFPGAHLVARVSRPHISEAKLKRS